jgi:hypothetical protein
MKYYRRSGFPKAVRALESMAMSDKNIRGPYLCVFGIAMDSGMRQIRGDKHGNVYSPNTEVWLSDYFWPSFTNFKYEDIMRLVLDVLEESHQSGDLATQVEVPKALLESFDNAYKQAQLVDDNGIFNDARKIVSFICSS